MYDNLSLDLTRVSLDCVGVSEATDHPGHKYLRNQLQFVLNLQPTIRHQVQHRTMRRWLELNQQRRSQAIHRQRPWCTYAPSVDMKVRSPRITAVICTCTMGFIEMGPRPPLRRSPALGVGINQGDAQSPTLPADLTAVTRELMCAANNNNDLSGSTS